jgi:hypothetical protein
MTWSDVGKNVVVSTAAGAAAGFVAGAIAGAASEGIKKLVASKQSTPAANLDDGLGTYGDQKGHHPMAKSAFKGDPNYNANDAVTVSADKLSEFGVRHPEITGQQHTLYSEYADTGQPLTMEGMANIETRAMVNAGVPESYAQNAVGKAFNQLIEWGVTAVSNIPWGGK